MSLYFKSLLLVASIPLIALALEPTNPSNLCDRFIGEKDIAQCKELTEKDEVDWYAGTVCNLQKEDKAFWECWNTVKGKKMNPQALDRCAETVDLTDEQRLECVRKSFDQRKPASDSSAVPFQPLIIKKSK